MRKVDSSNVYDLNNIVRYNPLSKIKTETVAAHSFFVIFYANDICTKFNLCDKIRLYSLQAALMHDIPEVVTNDITHDVKEMIPGLREMLQPYEEDIIKFNSVDAYEVLFDNKVLEHEVAKAVVELSDVLSVRQYCDNEVKLGNKRFVPLLNETKCRIEKGFDNLGIAVNKYNRKQN